MPPSVTDVLRAQWERLIDAVAEWPPEAYAGAGRVPGWRAAEHVAHLTLGVEALAARLAAPPPVRATQTALTHYDADCPALIDAAARAGAAEGMSAARLRAAVAVAADALTPASPNRLVALAQGGIVLDGYLRVCCVEAVLHGLDIGVEPDRLALRLAVRLLARILAVRAPGRSVEVRIPPFAAVQCVGGPRHTRGTPPNVVEAEPVAFVEIAAGRQAWSAAVMDGRVRASGERADLRPYLPLL